MFNHRNVPFAAAFAGMVSVQTGAAFAKTLFPLVGSEGVAALRLGLSSLVLVVALKPWRLNFRDAGISWLTMLTYGITLALMNLLIYRAFAYIPVSVAISIEVMGPLCAALLTSRRASDLVWIALAALGMVGLAIGDIKGEIDVRGVAFSLAAALFWGIYVLVGRRASAGGGQSVAVGMTIAAVIAVPLGVAQAGTALASTHVLLVGFSVAVLSSMLPFLLDIYAMRRLPARVFGVLLSGSPAVSAIAGWLVLNETLTPTQCAGIACVVAACAGCALFSRPRAEA
ncbi:EamA family transporter [Pandoraea commovens]|uniref:Threonine/homoserine exporter RhtA n=1 Tax=Pandoraea commovens TaxID=2508289 RepID=A0A5E4V4S2_9BURK|nr:EamA family transporter [Pandoraea commovens]VVE06369.1 threonine/homoserine exporter RhtA [Pandoraea commovens]